MAGTAQSSSSAKPGLHPRNLHRFGYNFAELVGSSPELAAYLFVNQYGNESVDFANPNAVKALNRALLVHFYGVEGWDIPDGYLCPPIPGRADYIHHLADLLAFGNDGTIPRGHSVRGLDVGVGASCVYPVIGCREYGWRFVGADIDAVAIESSSRIVALNSFLAEAVECRQQPYSADIFRNIILPDERFDFTLCNPPFHASPQEAAAGTQRKLRNLGHSRGEKLVLNFGGQANELWCEGGEEAFIRNMITQSADFSHQCFWFTTLVSKGDILSSIHRALKAANVADMRLVTMEQGQKISRVVAWTFLSSQEQRQWRSERWSGATASR
ncbi:MAG TPA: 23S rRNA (adenine(1618)-N(6))-methyltransferase RlmF [Williamwhitmania sp.]|nr:23S rRNA (adenine(1618)-N(6))-methyltransferase RlmF [Williamwhitmania sp.]